jgi:hypothetical protein
MGRRRSKNNRKQRNEDSNLVKRDPNSQKGDPRDRPGYAATELWNENIYYDYFYKVLPLRYISRSNSHPAQLGYGLRH